MDNKQKHKLKEVFNDKPPQKPYDLTRMVGSENDKKGNKKK